MTPLGFEHVPWPGNLPREDSRTPASEAVGVEVAPVAAGEILGAQAGAHAIRRPATLDDLIGRTAKINRANGWWSNPLDRSPQAILANLALIMTEAGEAVDAVQHGHFPGSDEFDMELADVVIRCLDLAARYDIDLEGAIVRKLEINAGRGYRHGGKVI